MASKKITAKREVINRQGLSKLLCRMFTVLYLEQLQIGEREGLHSLDIKSESRRQ